MSLTIQQSSEFQPTSVTPLKLRKNKNGGKAVYLNSGDNKKLFLQLPYMRSPYGLSAFTDEGTGERPIAWICRLIRTMPKQWLYKKS